MRSLPLVLIPVCVVGDSSGMELEMDYSIAIGINKYCDSEIPELKYAENDARMFHKIMQEKFDLDEEHCTLIIGKKATKRKIEEVISSLVIKHGDRIFFFYAGHGKCSYDDPHISCYDAEREVNGYASGWLDIKYILGVLTNQEANVVCFLDACESTVQYLPIPRGMTTNLALTSCNEKYVYVFSAADCDSKAYDEPEFEHGRWSHFLFAALQGEKDAQMEGRLTNNSLQNYLKKKLEMYSIKRKHTQKPYAWGKLSSEFVIRDFSEERSLEKNVHVKEIYFGTVDADNEYREQPDRFMENYFDLNSVSKSIMEQSNVQFVIGRKGTGKTYIGKYMAMKYPKSVKYFSMENFDYKAFAFLAKKASGYEAYVLPWKYYILANILASLSDIFQKQAILADLYGRHASMGQILHKKFKKGIRFRDDQLSEQWKNALAKDDDVFSIGEIVEIFSFILEDLDVNSYIFIIDGLDEKVNENPQYSNMMNALIWAIKSINDSMCEISRNIKCVVLFRKDIFEMVQGANTAKISHGSTVNLEWITPVEDKKRYPLYQFLNLRYKNCLREKGCKENNHELTEILPAKIRNHDTWGWILDFTTYKPRDVVKFLRECAVKCGDKDTCISEEVIWQAQIEYSRYLVSEFKNEIYGFVDEGIVKSLFRELHSMQKEWNTFEEMKRIINRCATSLKRPLTNEEILNILIKLYEVGALGVQLPNKNEQWYYRRSMVINEYIERSKFKLHRGMWKALSIW